MTSSHQTHADRGSPDTKRLSRRRRHWLMAVPLGLALMATAGCSIPGSAQKDDSSGPIVIGWQGGAGNPLSVTVGNDYFQKEMGPNAELKLFASGPAALSAVASGSLHYMCGLGLPPTVSAIAKDLPLEIVYAQERYTTGAGLVVQESSGISSVADLKGKTLAIVTGSQSTFELAAYLKGTGISPNDVKQLNMSPDQMQSAWTTGSITAALTWNPVLSYLSSHGGKVLKTDSDLPVGESSYNVCVANKDYAAAHPQVTAQLTTALGDGVEYLKTNRESALEVMAKETGTTVADVTAMLEGYQPFSLADQTTPNVLGSGSSDSAVEKSLLANWTVMHSGGFLSQTPPSSVAKYVNSSYAADAAKSK